MQQRRNPKPNRDEKIKRVFELAAGNDELTTLLEGAALTFAYHPYRSGPQDFVTNSCFAIIIVLLGTSSYRITPGPTTL